MENKYDYIGNSFLGNTWKELFDEIRRVMLFAPEVETRIGKTKELLNPVLILTNPRSRLFYSKHRSFNLTYAFVESFMVFHNQNNVKPFAYFNKKMNDYSDDGVTLNSAYGQFVADNIKGIVEKLKNDKNTRQGCIRIYDTKYGLSNTKDVPCTLDLHFLIRDNKLNMTTYMRSNDLFWGLQYDLFVFTTIQEVVANELGLELGVYIHCPTSLHVYDYHYDVLDKINSAETIDIPEIKITNSIDEMNKVAKEIIDLVNTDELSVSKFDEYINDDLNNDGKKIIEKYVLRKMGIHNVINIDSKYKLFLPKYFEEKEGIDNV